MEFNGLVGMDFDFFKKKDKMSKEEYETVRNEVKQHFRSLCYEVQKIYHKTTGGVLELDKEFQNFNKRSTSITAEHKKEINNFKTNIQLNSENLSIEIIYKAHDLEQCQYILDIIRNKKNLFWEFMMSSKNITLHVEFNSKSKKSTVLKVSGFDINNRNYDNIINLIEESIKEGKYEIILTFGYMFNKNECIKQSKNFANTVFDAFVSVIEMQNKLA